MQAQLARVRGKRRRKKLYFTYDHFYVDRSPPSPARVSAVDLSHEGRGGRRVFLTLLSSFAHNRFIFRNNTPMTTSTTYPSANLLRRLGAMLYDTLCCVAIAMLATALWLPFTQGQAIGEDNIFYRIYLFVIIFIFFTSFWTHGGQTLGMKAWRIKVINQDDDKPITFKQATRRFFAAIPALLFAGIGLWWMLFNKQHRTWQDYASGSRVIIVSAS